VDVSLFAAETNGGRGHGSTANLEQVVTDREASRAVRDAPTGEGQLAARDTQRVQLLVGGREACPKVVQEPFQRGAFEAQCLPDDEVLHAVRGHDHRVIAVRIRRQEVIAEDFQVDGSSQQSVGAARER
jgi:hypothetical protein